MIIKTINLLVTTININYLWQRKQWLKQRKMQYLWSEKGIPEAHDWGHLENFLLAD